MTAVSETGGAFAWDVLGLGCVAVDDLLYIPVYPPPDSKVRVRRRERQCGGLTGTALVAAARLGARCAFAGVLGDDEDSRFVKDAFRREGVDVSPIVHRAEARPIRSTILVDEGRHTRTIFFDLAGSTGADPEAPDAEVIRAARVLFVDHYGMEGMARAANRPRGGVARRRRPGARRVPRLRRAAGSGGPSHRFAQLRGPPDGDG